MKNKQENAYVKRSQKDYSMSFKLQVVQEIENEGSPLQVLKENKGFNLGPLWLIGCENLVDTWYPIILFEWFIHD